MRNKKKDIPYCGVRKEVIDKAEPEVDEESLNLFMSYITERYRIHVRKDVLHKEQPWTENEYLLKFRFTNIRREHDRETLYLIRHVTSNAFLTYRQKLLNVILFRLFNKHETFDICGAPFKFGAIWSYTDAVDRVKAYAKVDPDYVFFTGAFITTGTKSGIKKLFPNEPSTPACILKYMKRINTNGLMNRIQDAQSPDEVFKALCNEVGIGYFLAYQMFVDFTYIREFPFSENEYVVVGPGCKKGLDYLFIDRDGMSYEECLFWLRDNWEYLRDYCGKAWFDPEKEMIDLKHYDRVMNVMSLENCFCEFSKYYRAVYDLGRPRNRYTKSEEDLYDL